MRARRNRLAAALAVCVLGFPASGWSAEVVLRLKGGAGFEFVGNVKSYDGDSYVLEARSFGRLTLDAARFDCVGIGCRRLPKPQLSASAAPAAALSVEPAARQAASTALVIESADALGLSLVPGLIRGFATSTGASLKQLVGPDPKLQRFTATDAKSARTTAIELRRTDSGAALAALAGGRVGLALSARPMTGPESAAARRSGQRGRTQVSEHVLGLDGLTVIVSAANAASVVALDDVAGIFTGRITDWQQLGQAPAPIRIYATAEKGGATDRLAQIALGLDQIALPKGTVLLADEAEVSDAVARDPQGIAVTSMAFVRSARALDIKNACGLVWKPAPFAVKAEEYPLSRRVYLYASARGRTDLAHGLAAYAATDAGQAVIRDSQLVDQSIEWAAPNDELDRIEASRRHVTASDADRQLALSLGQILAGAQRLSATIRFANASSELDAKARQDLVRIAKLLGEPQLAGRTVLLAGFSDAVGSTQSNVELSAVRAARVRLALQRAVPKVQKNAPTLAARGFGPVAPVACNATERDRFLNRRVEVWVLPADTALAAPLIAADQRPDPPRKKAKAGNRRRI